MPFYWVTSATSASQTTQIDAIEIIAPAARICRIWRTRLWQVSDVSDAAEKILRVEWVRGNTTSGSGGQTTVITALNSSDSAASFQAELLNTTVATLGSPVSLAVGGWNVRIPLDDLYPPEQVIILANSERACFRVSAPADAITVNAACLVEQI